MIHRHILWELIFWIPFLNFGFQKDTEKFHRLKKLIYDENDKPICTDWQKWDWGGDDDGWNEPPEPPIDDPNQLMLFSVADDILENHKVKESIKL